MQSLFQGSKIVQLIAGIDSCLKQEITISEQKRNVKLGKQALGGKNSYKTVYCQLKQKKTVA